eukprot:SAG22_NODE_4_length_44774_cov_362.122149_37_plen_280_part_00
MSLCLSARFNWSNRGPLALQPLLLSADLTAVPNESMAILTNPGVLRINQDALGRMPFRFSSNAITGMDVWRKDLAGGDVAVAIVNMGTAASAAHRPGHAGVSHSENWTKISGRVYSDAACPNLNVGGDSVQCSHLKGAAAVSCCEAECWKDLRCDAINVDPDNGHCIMRGCTAANLAHPDKPAPKISPGFDSYHLAKASPPPAAQPGLAPGFRLDLTDVGFMFNTRVRVKEIWSGTDLGVHVGEFVTTESIPPHGTQLLRLSYAPLYPPHGRRRQAEEL